MARAYLRHALAAGHCRTGVKLHLERWGIDFSEIAGPGAPGIDTERLRALGGPHVDEIADLAEAEEEARRG